MKKYLRLNIRNRNVNIKLKESEKGNNCNIKYTVNLNIVIKENVLHSLFGQHNNISNERGLSTLRKKGKHDTITTRCKCIDSMNRKMEFLDIN